MNAIVKQLGVQHIVMPLHQARCIVMRDRTIRRSCDDNEEEEGNDQAEVSQSQSKRSSVQPHSNHVASSSSSSKHAWTLNVDPYVYDWDSDSDSDDDDDDDVYSEEETTSCSSAESSSDDETPLHHDHTRVVTFATPLVTASYVRPTTTVQDKVELYYTEMDYREFRRNYIMYSKLQQRATTTATATTDRSNKARHCCGSIRTKPSVVQFHTDLISDVQLIPSVDNPSELYYSRSELQTFLDDFVASLSKGV